MAIVAVIMMAAIRRFHASSYARTYHPVLVAHEVLDLRTLCVCCILPILQSSGARNDVGLALVSGPFLWGTYHKDYIILGLAGPRALAL